VTDQKRSQPQETSADGATLSFPRQRAVTRGFRLGAARAFRIVRRSDGSARVFFIRSKDGRTASGDLWCADQNDQWIEKLLVRAATVEGNGELPPAERARRERLREVTAGITTYSLDADGSHAAFVVDGTPYVVAVDTGEVTELANPGPVVDPQISPDGKRVAFVHDNRVWCAELVAAEATCLTPEEGDAIGWGLADFIASEELERHRGMWWLADSQRLLVERVDESDVETRWIADPAQPEHEPIAHRYPSAGTPNAAVSLHVVGIDGTITETSWDRQEYCYLASVTTPSDHKPLISVLDRTQQHQQVLELIDDRLVVRAEHTQEPWITVIAGSPNTDPTGALVEVLDRDGSFRACRDGEAFSPVGWNIDAILDVDADGVTVQAALDPETRVLARIDFTGDATILTDSGRWSAGTANGDVRVVASTSIDQTRSTVTIIDSGHTIEVKSAAEQPNLTPRPRLMRVGERDLSAAVLLPTNHEPGMQWPVICSPYGGPHAQRVIAAGGAYLTEQWLADQGFAVVVIDGRGTPGRGPQWEYAVHHDLAGPVLEDQVDALHAVAAQEEALDLSRVGIRGWSFGGYLAALAVLDRPDVFHAAVAGAPVTEWQLYDTAYTERYLGNPNDDAIPYERTSLLTRAAQLTRPLLLIHGLADDNVLAAHTLQMSSALLAAGRQHNVLPLSGVTHMTPQEVVAENLLLAEVDFFRANLG
jgi:dipeptidyl-peptidase-4